MLTTAQQNRVRVAVYRSCSGCARCAPFEVNAPTWVSTLGDAVLGALDHSGVAAELTDPAERSLDELIRELGLRCATCGSLLASADQEVTQALPEARGHVLVSVPTIDETPTAYHALTHMWMQVPHNARDVTFTFVDCDFVRPTTIAFLGGAATSIRHRGGNVSFAWGTMSTAVRLNLFENGFGMAFGANVRPWPGDTLPYRQDRRHDEAAIIAYLRQRWLRSDWLRMSSQLIDRIVGNVWEIYENAFEYSGSALGVFTCGQHMPATKELTLTVLDLGQGIPANVRSFLGMALEPDDAMKWAFHPGNTTNPRGIGRGLGLDLLRNFVAVNNGRLEVSSRAGYAEVTAQGVRFDRATSPFPGTAVRISLRCDESSYALVQRTSSTPFF